MVNPFTSPEYEEDFASKPKLLAKPQNVKKIFTDNDDQPTTVIAKPPLAKKRRVKF